MQRRLNSNSYQPSDYAISLTPAGSSASTFFFNTICPEVATKLKKRIIAGISWRRTMADPMIIKIQRATPASLKLIDRAKAGEARRRITSCVRVNPKPTSSFFILKHLLFDLFCKSSNLQPLPMHNLCQLSLLCKSLKFKDFHFKLKS